MKIDRNIFKFSEYSDTEQNSHFTFRLKLTWNLSLRLTSSLTTAFREFSADWTRSAKRPRTSMTKSRFLALRPRSPAKLCFTSSTYCEGSSPKKCGGWPPLFPRLISGKVKNIEIVNISKNISCQGQFQSILVCATQRNFILMQSPSLVSLAKVRCRKSRHGLMHLLRINNTSLSKHEALIAQGWPLYLFRKLFKSRSLKLSMHYFCIMPFSALNTGFWHRFSQKCRCLAFRSISVSNGLQNALHFFVKISILSPKFALNSFRKSHVKVELNAK